MYMYIHMYVCIYIYMYIYVYDLSLSPYKYKGPRCPGRPASPGAARRPCAGSSVAMK